MVDDSASSSEGGLSLGEGAQITVGSGDVAGRDKITAGRDVIQVGAGATVIVGAVPTAQVGDGLRALNDLAKRFNAVREAIVTFRTEFAEASRQIDELADYKDLHDLLHQLEFECYAMLAAAAPEFPDDVDPSLSKYQVKLEDIADQLQKVAGRGTVRKKDTVWITRFATLSDELDKALNDSDKKLFDNVLGRLKQVVDIQPTPINEKLNSAARALRLSLLAQTLAQVRDHLGSQDDLDPDKLSQFQLGVDALVNLALALEKLRDDHDGWQKAEALFNRSEDMLALVGTSELEMTWPDIKALTEPLCAERTDKPARRFLEEAAALDEALASANPERMQDSFRKCRARAGQIFYRIDLDLKRLCGELRKVGEPLDAVLRLTK